MSGGVAIERRAIEEVRASGRRLEGYAATFGRETRIGSFREMIAPGAFAASLTGDVLALRDHDAARVLGRTKSGTLRLSEDSRGLAFSLDLPDTADGRDVAELVSRGDAGGMSFGFTVPKGGDAWTGELRTLLRVELHEVSVVSAWPAYPDTSLALRSRSVAAGAARRERALWLWEAGACR